MYINQQKYNIFTESLESYYWLGFLFADGTFRKRGEIKLSISVPDLLHLEKFKKFANSSNKITIIKNKYLGKYTTNDMATFNINDGIHIKALCKKFNIQSNKTKNPPLIRISEMSDDQMLALIIGYIDGDGCFLKNNKSDAMLSIEVHPNWLMNLKIIEENLRNITKIKFKENLSKINVRGYAALRICNMQVLKFIKRFAIDNNLPILDRKWEIITLDFSYREKKKQTHQLILPIIKTLKEQNNMSFTDIQKYINTNFNLSFVSGTLMNLYYKLK